VRVEGLFIISGLLVGFGLGFGAARHLTPPAQQVQVQVSPPAELVETNKLLGRLASAVESLGQTGVTTPVRLRFDQCLTVIQDTREMEEESPQRRRRGR